jgi:hypothetical protein
VLNADSGERRSGNMEVMTENYSEAPVGRDDFMEPDKSAEDLAKIQEEIVALRRRLRVTARRNRKLSSETELLLKKVVGPE